jgi:hypothetical protein
MQLHHARWMFYVAAFFNIFAVVLLHPATGIAAMLDISPTPSYGVFDQVALVAIFAFGVGYWMAGNNPDENRNIVKLGMFSKFGVVAIIVAHFLTGTANVRLLMLVSGDVLFGSAFLYFLLTHKRQSLKSHR